MQQLKWQSLDYRRQTAKLAMMYKIQHGLVDIPLNKYTQPARTHCATEHLAARSRGHPLQLMVQRSQLQAYKHSFFISTIEPWNKLTVQTINAPSTEVFKQCLERDNTAKGCDILTLHNRDCYFNTHLHFFIYIIFINISSPLLLIFNQHLNMRTLSTKSP